MQLHWLTSRLCMHADPFANDENFLLSVLSLEELGATGNKVCFEAAHVSQ